MNIEHYYRVETVALGVIALFAAAGVWIELAAPETSFMSAALAIIWCLITLVWLVSSVRRKLGLISQPRPRPWMILAFSLFCFFALFLAIGEFETYGLAKIVSFIMFLVLAVFLLFAAIVKWRHARSIQEDE